MSPADRVRRAQAPHSSSGVRACVLLASLAACRAGVITARDDAAVPDATSVDGWTAIADARELAADASSNDASDETSAPGHVLYEEGRTHSPITSDIARKMRSIASPSTDAHFFSKVGDSITKSRYFLTCLGGPFQRDSLAAANGWTTADVIAGSPSPLDQELAAVHPRYAIMMLGMNDARLGRTVDAFGTDLWRAVDHMIAAGTVPIMSTIPAILSDSAANARVPLFNRVIRAIAQGRSVPLIDYHLAMDPLASDGIGADGIHPTVDPPGACIFTADGLRYGYNMRNMTTLEVLGRARLTIDGQTFDADAPRREGRGSYADPFRGTLPLVDLADTRRGELANETYTKCGLIAAGHEIIYRLDLASRIRVKASVVDHDGVDVDVAILAGAPNANACVASGDHGATALVGPGAVYIIVDSKTMTTEGEFVLVVERG